MATNYPTFCLKLPITAFSLEKHLDIFEPWKIYHPNFEEPEVGKQTPMVTIPATISLTKLEP